MNWYHYEIDEVKRIGSYPAVKFMDDIYEIDEIASWKEETIDDVRKYAKEKNVDVLCIRNLDDKTKCKVIMSFSGRDYISKENADGMPELFLYICC